MNKFLYTYIQNQEAKNGDINPEIRKEYDDQRKFLENSMASLKKRVEVESEIHKQDNQKSMNDNVLLLKDIKELRGKVRQLETKLKDKKTKRTELEKQIKGFSNGEDSLIGHKKSAEEIEEI